MSKLGTTVRTLRARVGLSQEDLAHLVGLTQGQVSRLEGGRAELVRTEVLARLASALGVSPSVLIPETTPWRASPSDESRHASVFRVGCWESVWSAPVIALAEETLTSTRLSSRVRTGALFTVIDPEVQRDPQSRPLTPPELLRALRSTYYVAIVVPRTMVLEHPDELTECAQIAIAVDGVHVAVCMRKSDMDASTTGSSDAVSDSAVSASVAWDHVRKASANSVTPVYSPTDVGVADLVHRLRGTLGGRISARFVRQEQWPAFLGEVTELVASGGGPAVAIAPEPLLDTWRRSIWESHNGLMTVPVSSGVIWPDAPSTLSALSLVFQRERSEAWLTNPVVYDFLAAVEREAQEIATHSPRTLGLLAERLRLDVPAILRECARCDYTTKFAPSWVAQLRARPRAVAS